MPYLDFKKITKTIYNDKSCWNAHLAQIIESPDLQLVHRRNQKQLLLLFADGVHFCGLAVRKIRLPWAAVSVIHGNRTSAAKKWSGPSNVVNSEKNLCNVCCVTRPYFYFHASMRSFVWIVSGSPEGVWKFWKLGSVWARVCSTRWAWLSAELWFRFSCSVKTLSHITDCNWGEHYAKIQCLSSTPFLRMLLLEQYLGVVSDSFHADMSKTYHFVHPVAP